MKNFKPKNRLSIFDVMIVVLFITFILLSYVPVFSIIAIMNPSSTSSSEAYSNAQQQMGMLYDLSKKKSLATTLSTLETDYTIITEVNYTTLTKKDINTESIIKLTQNFPTKGMTKVELKVKLIHPIDSHSTSEIETILFFR